MCVTKNTTYSPNSLAVRWPNESVLRKEMKAEGFRLSGYEHHTPFCFVPCAWNIAIRLVLWPLGNKLQGSD